MSDAHYDDTISAARFAKYRQTLAAQIASFKAIVTAQLAPLDNISDSMSITMALLELAFDRHVAVHDSSDFDLIEVAYQQALKRSRARCNETSAASQACRSSAEGCHI